MLGELQGETLGMKVTTIRDAKSAARHLGSRLAQARRGRGMTQGDLGREVGIDLRAVKAIEAGAREPKAGLLARLAVAVDAETDVLLGLTSPDCPPPGSKVLFWRGARRGRGESGFTMAGPEMLAGVWGVYIRGAGFVSLSHVELRPGLPIDPGMSDHEIAEVCGFSGGRAAICGNGKVYSTTELVAAARSMMGSMEPAGWSNPALVAVADQKRHAHE